MGRLDSPEDFLRHGVTFGQTVDLSRLNGTSIPVPGSAEKSGLELTWFDDITPCLDTLDFVQGLLVERSAAVVYGESNAGKTFWSLDLALHVAAGKPWFGRRVEQGGVIYCALEGGFGFRNRVTAWKRHYAAAGQPIPFAAISSPLNLLDPDADTLCLIEAIHGAATQISVPVKLIVIDTLSRALAGGNENAPDDMGSLVANMDRIRDQTGACVLFIHHSGKDAAKGARGHSLLRAAIDTEVEVVAADGGLKTATVVKQRELKKGDAFSFKLDVVELGQNRHGEVVTTCVVAPSDDQLAVPVRTRLSKSSQIAADLLRRAQDKYGRPLPAGLDYPPNTIAVTDDQWREAFYAGDPRDNIDAKRQALHRAKIDLLAKHVIASLNGWIWFVRRADE